MIGASAVRRLIPAAAAGTLFLVAVTLWLVGARQAYTTLFWLMGFNAYRFPFLDTHAILSAVECYRRGIDVYVTNPCDVGGRLHVYAPAWLHLDLLPITTSWTGPVGLALDLTFIVSLTMLPPVRRSIDSVIMTFAAISPAVGYALERGNNDVLVFMFAILAGWLALRSSRLRRLGHAFAVLGAVLKFYPLTLLILAWRERWSRCVVIVVLSLTVAVVCFLPDRVNLIRGLRLVPMGTVDSFGAGNIPAIFALNMHWPLWSRVLIEAVLVGVMARWAFHWSHKLQPGLTRMCDAKQVFLTVGSILMVGCFLAGESNQYRAIHLLFVLPALLALAENANDRIPRVAVGLVLWAMWGSALRASQNRVDVYLWLTDQCVWWVLVSVLSAFLLAQFRESMALKTLLMAVGGRPAGPIDVEIADDRRRNR